MQKVGAEKKKSGRNRTGKQSKVDIKWIFD